MSKSIKKLVLAAGLTLAMGFAHAAQAAAPAAPAGDDMFTAMDANKDGVLTKEEFAVHGMADDFAKYDKNGDGKVTREEYDATAAGMAKMPGM